MTLNDKRYLLCSVARKYANRKYEIDELINEAWLDENVRSQTDFKRLCIAAHWAMINYMRTQEKRNWKKFHIYTHPLQLDDGYVVEPEVVPFSHFELQHDLTILLKSLTPKQKLVIRLRMEGVNLRDIGKKMGLTRERIRQIESKAHRIMKRRYEKNRVA
jgi:RNA polymerase sigma factor (sigma-70 family)